MHSTLILSTALATVAFALPNAYDTSILARDTDPSTLVCLANNKPPKSATCYSKTDYGHISKPAVLSSSLATQATDFETCRDGCESLTACKSFRFSPFATTCSYYKKSLKAMGFTTDPDSQDEFNDRQCYKCSACKITFSNGDFETGVLKPWQDGFNTVTIVHPDDNSSKYVAEVKVPSKDDDEFGNGGGITQEFGQCKGTQYKLSFSYRVTQYASSFFNVVWSNSEYSGQTPHDIYEDFNPAVGAWKSASVLFTPQYNNYGLLIFKARGRDSNNAVYQLDNITIVPA